MLHEFFLSAGKWNIQARSRYPCPAGFCTVSGVYPDPDLVLEITSPDNAHGSSSENAETFTIERGSVDGLICYEGKTTRVRVWFENGWWYSHREYTALEILLVRVFYTLSRREGYKSFLMHASAVAKDSLGYMFLGPSESGKTTVASLPFDGKTLLHDDVVTLHVDGENVYIQGSPFHTRLSVVDTELMVPGQKISEYHTCLHDGVLT